MFIAILVAVFALALTSAIVLGIIRVQFYDTGKKVIDIILYILIVIMLVIVLFFVGLFFKSIIGL